MELLEAPWSRVPLPDPRFAGFLSVISYRQGKKVLWDAKADKYTLG